MSKKKAKKLVASVAAYRGGKLLFQLRSDRQVWCLPGGHLEEGEEVEEAARRELKEETGLDAEDMKYLGSGVVRREAGDIRIFCFRCEVTGEPTGEHDPDQEAQTFRFVDVSRGIPEDISVNLQNRNDVTLRYLGLQIGDIRKYEQSQPLVKAEEDDIDSLIATCDPAEISMALKMPGVERRHVEKVLGETFKREGSSDNLVRQVLQSPHFDGEMAHKALAEAKENPYSVGSHTISAALYSGDQRLDADLLRDVLESKMKGTYISGAEQAIGDPRTPQSVVEAYFGGGERSAHVRDLLMKRYGFALNSNVGKGTAEDLGNLYRVYQAAGYKGSEGRTSHLRYQLRDALEGVKEIPQAVQDGIVADGEVWMIENLLKTGLASNDVVKDVVESTKVNPLSSRSVALRLAAVNSASPEVLEGLMRDPSTSVVAATAKAKNLTVEQMKRLVRTNDAVVDRALVARQDLPHDVICAFGERGAGGQLDENSASKLLKNHPELPGHVLTKLAPAINAGGALSASGRFASQPNVTLSDLRSLHGYRPWSDTEESALKVWDDSQRRLNKPGMPSEELDRCAASPNPTISLWALSHPNVPESALRAGALAGKRGAFLNKRVPADAVRQYLLSRTQEEGHYDLGVDGALEANDGLHPLKVGSDAIDHVLSVYQNPSIRAAAFKHPDVSEDTVRKLLPTEPAAAWFFTQLKRKISPETFEAAMMSSGPMARERAVYHPDAPQSIIERGGRDNNGRVVSAALETGKLSDDTLEWLGTQKYPQDILNGAKRQIVARNPDSAFKEKVGVRFDTGKLRKVRDIITSQPGRTSMRPKDLPPGDWSAGRGRDGNIHAELLQQAIDQKPSTTYNVSHSAYGDAQLHSKEPSKVFQLSATTDQINRMKEAGVYDTFKRMHDASMQSAHPVSGTHGIGWVRYTQSGSHAAMKDCEDCEGKGHQDIGCSGCDSVGSLSQQCGTCVGEGKNQETCPECEGSGNSLETQGGNCDLCRGSGKVESECSDCGGDGVFNAECPDCGGAGSEEVECRTCEGTGRGDEVAEEQTGPRAPSPWPSEKGEFFIDETQSDLGQDFVRQASAQAKEAGQDPEEAAQAAEEKYPSAHFKTISQILFAGKHPNEVLQEAFAQHLRDRGHVGATTQIHTVESKAPISLGKRLPTKCKTCGRGEAEHGTSDESHEFKPVLAGQLAAALADLRCAREGSYGPRLGKEPLGHTYRGEASGPCKFIGCGKPLGEHGHLFVPGPADRLKAPAHFNVSYHDVPKKMGAEPSTYGKLKTQTNQAMVGEPTWENKIRKSVRPDHLRDVKGALSEDLRREKYRGNPNPMAGHCYVASEALYHLAGGPDSGYVPPQPSKRAQVVIDRVKKPIRKFEDSLTTWLGTLPLVKMAIKPQDLAGVARYHAPAGAEAVDHTPDLTAHPPEHHALVEAFRTQVLDKPEYVRRGKTGTSTASNSTGKAVWDVHHQVGDQAEHRFMVKPYMEKITPRMKKWCEHPYHGGWAEMTNQALYHAGGIGHLHQKVHVAEVPLPQKQPESKTEPALVVHMQPGVENVVGGVNVDPNNDLYDPALRQDSKQIGLMDFLTGNLDRHGHNLLYDRPNDRFLAIDHSRSFQYKSASKGGPSDIDSLRNYISNSALGDVLSPPDRHTGYGEGWDQNKSDRDYWSKVEAYNESWNPTFEWWGKNSPAIRKAFERRVEQVRDLKLRGHLMRNFEARARQLDQYAQIGHENFGHEPKEWMASTIPIYRPNERADGEEEQAA